MKLLLKVFLGIGNSDDRPPTDYWNVEIPILETFSTLFCFDAQI
jgi:hypothetical protein